MQDSEENTDNSSKKKRESKFLRKKNTHIHADTHSYRGNGEDSSVGVVVAQKRKKNS